MINLALEKNKKKFLFLIIFLLGALSRSYNINFEDFTTDEIFAFWTSEPNISFKETLVRTLSSNFNCLFDFLLKWYHLLLGYDVHLSIYFPLILSLISLIFFYIFLKNNTSQNSAILGFFLLSVNIFHIKYSVELRSYILTFLLTIIFFLLNFKDRKPIKVNSFRLIGIILTSILMVLSHSFTLLIFFSFILYKLIVCVSNKRINANDIILLSSLILISLSYLFIYLPINISFIGSEFFMDKSISPHWFQQVKLSFYTNYFFSHFFGSRIIGLIYLLVFFYLLLKFIKKIIKNQDIYLFLIIMIFISYFIPVTYGYLFTPVLQSRYIFFVLIPIIALLAHLIFENKNIFLKKLLIILLVVPTLVNHIIYENSFKKFYTKIDPAKPQVRDGLQIINNSGVRLFTVKNNNALEPNTYEAYVNYIYKYVDKLNLKIDFFDYQNTQVIPNNFWIIQIKDNYKIEFDINEEFESYNIENEIYLNSIELRLIKVKAK